MYTALDLGLDYQDYEQWDKYMSDDYYPEEYNHDYLNDDKYELPF
jgi:hypothetical protein